MAKKVTLKSNKVKKSSAAPKTVALGKLYVTASFNNTIVTLTDTAGKTLSWSSSGNAGFKGARRATPFAAISAVEKVAAKGKSMGMAQVEVYIKGPGPGRDASVRALKNSGLNITMIADVTPMPHNGPRAEKRRRV